MPRPVDPCEQLRRRIAQLKVQLKNEMDLLRNEPFPARQAIHQENIDRILSQIDHERALLEEMGCDIVPQIPGPPRPKLPNVRIDGIETTQAIQYFGYHPPNPNTSSVPIRSVCPPSFFDEFRPINSVPLVAGKPTVLRVYLDNRMFHEPFPTSVTGVLSYSQLRGSSWVSHPDRSPINGPIPVNLSSSVINRGNANHTVNFLIPAEHCFDSIDLTVRAFDPAHPEGNTDILKMVLQFRNVGDVRIHGVLVNYTGLDAAGNNVNIPAPTGLQLVRILEGLVRRMYPIRGFRYTGCEMIQFNGTIQVSGTTNNAVDLVTLVNNQLAGMSFASGGHDVYVGLLPATAPGGGGYGGTVTYNTGLTVGAAVAYSNDNGTVLAQEIGHAFRGGGHVPCRVPPPQPDNCYPIYHTYPRGSIGEFGLDYTTSQVFNPTSTFDFMSYCSPVWVSPYTYVELMNAIVGGRYTVMATRRAPQSFREYLFLKFRMDREGKVVVLPSFHLPVPDPGQGIGPESPIYCDLLDAEQQILDSSPCYSPRPDRNPYAPYKDFHLLMPWNMTTRSIAFYRNSEHVYTFEVEGEPPTVTIQNCKFAKGEGNIVRVEWSGECATKPIHYMLRYSHDNGKSWRALAIDLTTSSHVVNLDMLPGGEQCVFQVVTYAGVRTTVASTDPFSVPQKPRQAYILSPEPSCTFSDAEPIVLLGGGFSPDFWTTEFEDVVWNSSLDGFLGTGHEIVLHTLSIGRHRIEVNIPDGVGGKALAGKFIEVKPRVC